MIEFDPQNPFPLLSEGCDFEDEKRHAAQADAWLGFEIERIEKELLQKEFSNNPPEKKIDDEQEFWLGLALQSLQTPYTEIRTILNLLNLEPGSRIVDLGAAYGRMGFVIGRHYPRSRFIGFEAVAERVVEAKRCSGNWNYGNVSFERADLKAHDFSPPAAEFYFIYDFGSRKAIAKILDDLSLVSRRQLITVVGRGRSSRDAIEHHHPWLSQIVAPQHFKNFSIYRSR